MYAVISARGRSYEQFRQFKIKSSIHHLWDKDSETQVKLEQISCNDTFYGQISGFNITIKLSML